MDKKQRLNALLTQKRLVKVIAGIDNFDSESVAQVVTAAQLGGADAVDVAAKAEIVQLARQLTDAIVFASAVEPEALKEAIAAGADVAEIGNFDALYAKGFYISAEAVLDLVRKTQAVLPEGTPLSVTVPGHLSTEAQIQLAKQLATMGVSMIQTEGIAKVVGTDRSVPTLTAEEKARMTFENTQALCYAVGIPVMTASGIQARNVQTAFNMGAAAVGVGSAVNKLSSQEAMVAEIQAIMASVRALSEQTVAVS